MLILLSFIVTAFLLQYEIFESFILDKISPKQLLLLGIIGLTLFVAVVLIFKYSKNQKLVAIKHKISGLIDGFWSITKMKKKMGILCTYNPNLGVLFSYVLCNNICFTGNFKSKI